MWKDEMDKYYNLLNDVLTPDNKQCLVSSQKQWEAFTKENDELTLQTYRQIYQGGSIVHIFAADIYYDKYKTRAVQLKALYDFINLHPK